MPMWVLSVVARQGLTKTQLNFVYEILEMDVILAFMSLETEAMIADLHHNPDELHRVIKVGRTCPLDLSSDLIPENIGDTEIHKGHSLNDKSDGRCDGKLRPTQGHPCFATFGYIYGKGRAGTCAHSWCFSRQSQRFLATSLLQSRPPSPNGEAGGRDVVLLS